ncbi:MAG: SRPBCC family protein [Hyphomicrobiaceae bacterium]
MEIRVETRILAPRTKVFALAADIPRWPELIGAIERIEMLTPGPVAPGTRFRETRRMYGRSATEEMTLAEMTPPERFVLTAAAHGARYRVEHIFVPDGNATRLTLAFSAQPTTFLARLFQPLAKPMAGHLRKQLAADLADLKRASERSDMSP